MNAERLHAVAVALRDDLKETDAPSLLAQLRDALRQQVGNPADPASQQQVSDLRARLVEALANAPSNAFPPSWVLALEELEIADLFGERLRAAIEEIFQRNEITPSTAADEIEELAGRVQAASASIDGLIAAFESLGIGAEELDYGEFEVGVLIPRPAVANRLRPLANELAEIDGILLVFQELTTGSRPDYEVRSISSSAFQVFLQSPGGTAMAIAVAIERVVALYKQLLEIRLGHKKLAEAGVPEEKMGGVKEYADEHMEAGIGQLVDELMDQFAKEVEEGRANELKVELRLSLNKIANRIDRGYSLEVRAGLPPADEEGDEAGDGGDKPDDDARRQYEAVASRRDALQFMNLTGSPILSLPESSEEPDQQGGEGRV